MLSSGRTFLRRSECCLRPRWALYSTKAEADAAPPPPRNRTVAEWASENKLEPGVARWASTARKPPDRAIPTLRVLDRPLGVRERPSLTKQTRLQRFKDIWLVEEKILEERKHLIKQLNKGYYSDALTIIHPGHMGKTWIAPEVLIREDAIESTELSVLQTKSFINSVYPRFQDNPLYQRVHINIQENALKALVLYGNCLLSTQSMEYLREPMGCTNRMVGYVYLIDENLKIRWAAGGDATLAELQALESCTAVLLKRLEEKNKKGKKPPPVESPPPVKVK
ncbi:ATP10 protein-domain-containing protein [Mycena metata]|uniref:ATP10 protein-domain-containing protein n=1 Tax=Mycena metata TaxID=1033252 RepID=A0AAD7P0F8_9AGAR|nr:ATP10 protein-domain-containing protein [Mycena metata]